jgi:ABC-type glycerol-3-phosphate transport system substrate-binding protein
MDLTQAMEAKEAGASWKEEFFEKALAVNEFAAGNEFGIAPGIYGVPLDGATIQMLYNKKLYRQAGLDPDRPPATWDDFMRHCRALKEKGISCFVSGFGEIWMIDAFASNYAMNIMGEEKVFDTYRGNVSYTDPDWLAVFSLFKQLYDDKILVDGAVTMVNKTSEQVFANERAAYTFNGSWCVNVLKGMNPVLDYAAMPPPAVSQAHPMRIWGGAGASFVVNAKSPKADMAVRFLKWLTDKKQQEALFETTENFPANKAALEKTSRVLSEFAGGMETATHPNIYPVHEVPAVTEAFDKGIQSILIGEKTPEQVAKDVQGVKEKEMARRS